MNKRNLTIAAAALVAAGCAGMMESEPQVTDAQVLAVMKKSFLPKGRAQLDRLDQDEMQKLCSEAGATGKPLAKEVSDRLEKAQAAVIKYPSNLMGDWKSGERIAQTGVGKQYTDDPATPAGGNCYACHQLAKAELAFGTIGPPLYNFGKIRGFTPAMQKYAYGKVYNSQAFSACSSMPRFGHQQILTEKQIQDVVALLMEPESPVNK